MAGVPPTQGGTGSLLARLVLPGLVGVMLLLLAQLLLLLVLLLLDFLLDFLWDFFRLCLSTLYFSLDLTSLQCLWCEEHSSSLWLESDF